MDEMTMCDYSVGQQVKCIESRWGATTTGGRFQMTACPNLPRVGWVYRIRTIEKGNDGYVFVRLVEVHNPINPNTNSEPVFQATQFVPLGRETDIGFAYDLLKYPGPLAKETAHERRTFRRKKESQE